MKQYLVFAYDAYYPAGGWDDFKGSFDNEQDALVFADSIEPKYSGGVEVVDLKTEKDIYVYRQHRT